MCSNHIIPRFNFNIMLYFFQYCCTLFFLGFSLWVVHAKSPVESVLYLILTFCNASVLLFVYNIEFIAVIYVIVYVGAVAVLFLFVIMMLDIKVSPFESTTANNSFFFCFSFALLAYIIAAFNFGDIFDSVMTANSLSDKLGVYLIFDPLTNTEILGQALFNYFLPCVLMAGLILLVALIGSIVLTLRFNSIQKGQIASRQLSRSDNFLSFGK